MAEQSKLSRPAAAPTNLNDLPDCILIQILSLLPCMMSIIEASFISRRWRNIWHFIPNLEFYLDEPYSDDPEEHLRHINTITQVLLNRPNFIPFTVFRLATRYFPNHRHRSLIHSWLRYALDCRVEEISVKFDCRGNDDPKNLYDFHFSDLSNRHVKRLSLYKCEILMLPGNVSSRFDSLRVLELSNVDVADVLLTNMISGCRNLEELCLDLFAGVRNFRICSKSVKFLKLSNFIAGANREHSSVEFYTPNLSKIKVKDFYTATFTGDLLSVKEAEVVFSYTFNNTGKCWFNVMNMLSGVENLKVKGFVPSKIEFDEYFQLRRLKHLELIVGYRIDDLLVVSLLLDRSPALETLCIIYRRDYGEEDEEKCFDALSFVVELETKETKFCSLREVSIEGFRNGTTENLILHLLEDCRVVLNKVVLVPENFGEARVVLDPTAGALCNLLNNHFRVLLVAAVKEKAELVKQRDELAEARRALICMTEDLEEEMEGEN